VCDWVSSFHRTNVVGINVIAPSVISRGSNRTEAQILLEQMSLELEFVEQVIEKRVVSQEKVSFEQKVQMPLGKFSLNKCHWNDYTKSKELSSFRQMLLDQALFEKASLD
jgi:hypothetical protein